MSIAVNGNYYGAGAGVDGYKGTAKFIPDVWSGKLQVKYYVATCLSEITNNDWEGEIKDTGDKVIIRSTPTITISNYTKGLPLATQVPTSTPIELNIDKGKYFQVVVDDVDKVQADLSLMNLFTDDAGEQMKIAVELDVFGAVPALAHASNRGNTAGAISANVRLGTTGGTNGANNAFVGKQQNGTGSGADAANAKSVIDHIVDMNLCLDEANVPETGRWMVLPAALAARIKKSELRDASVTGDGQSVMRNGRLGMIDRTTLYTSNNVTKTVEGTGASFTIFAGTRDAISFASQITKMETLRSQSTFGDLVRGLNVYGYQVTKPEAMVTSVVQLV